MRKVLITDINSFIGRHLAVKLYHSGYEVLGTARSDGSGSEMNLQGGQFHEAIIAGVPVKVASIADITACTDWSNILVGVDVIVHLAGRVHVRKERPTDALVQHRKINVDGTVNLARHAAGAGVRRFVFMSTVGVYGHAREDGPVTEESAFNATTAYAISKLEAEKRLDDFARASSMETAIIRSPLVYGPQLKGNFYMLLRFVAMRVPSPFAAVQNRRHFVYIENLTELVALCTERSEAAEEVFLVADEEVLSTAEWIRRIADAMGRYSVQIGVSPRVLKIAMGIVRKKAAFDKLCGDFVIDTSKAERLLAWKPRVAVESGVRSTVQWFLHGRS